MTVQLPTRPPSRSGCVAIHLPALRNRAQQPAVFDAGRGHPSVDALLDPDGDGDRPNAPPPFALEVSQHPPAFSLLDGRDVELGQLVPPEGATDQKGQDDIVALPFQGVALQLNPGIATVYFQSPSGI
jgi:hypothetical protein